MICDISVLMCTMIVQDKTAATSWLEMTTLLLHCMYSKITLHTIYITQTVKYEYKQHLKATLPITDNQIGIKSELTFAILVLTEKDTLIEQSLQNKNNLIEQSCIANMEGILLGECIALKGQAYSIVCLQG